MNKEMSTRGNGAGSPTLLRSDIGFMRTIYQRGYYIYGASLLSTWGCPWARVGMIPNNMPLYLFLIQVWRGAVLPVHALIFNFVILLVFTAGIRI